MADATAAAAGRRSDGDDNRGDGNSSGPPVLTFHMTSDNVGDSLVVSSGCSDFLSSKPGAKTGRLLATAVITTTTTTTTTTAAKGILVHNNKKSANTNRVSFVTNSSSPPSVDRSKKKHNQLRRPNEEGNDVPLPYHARTGRRLTGFGVKSYLHEFYDEPDGTESFQNRRFSVPYYQLTTVLEMQTWLRDSVKVEDLRVSLDGNKVRNDYESQSHGLEIQFDSLGQRNQNNNVVLFMAN